MIHLFKAVVVAVPAIVGILMLAGPPEAQGQVARYFSVGQSPTNLGGANGNAFVLVPARGNASQVVTLLQMIANTNDVNARLAFFTNAPGVQVVAGSTNTVQMTEGAAAGVGTNGFAAGDLVLIQHSSGLVERSLITLVGTTNIILTNVLATAVSAGATIYRIGTNMVLNGITNVVGAVIYASPNIGAPLMIETSITAKATLPAVAGFYEYAIR